jgi:hypothetical protein
MNQSDIDKIEASLKPFIEKAEKEKMWIKHKFEEKVYTLEEAKQGIKAREKYLFTIAENLELVNPVEYYTMLQKNWLFYQEKKEKYLLLLTPEIIAAHPIEEQPEF